MELYEIIHLVFEGTLATVLLPAIYKLHQLNQDYANKYIELVREVLPLLKLVEKSNDRLESKVDELGKRHD